MELKQSILISGLPGEMATQVTQALLNDDRYAVIRYALVGPDTTTKTVSVRSSADKKTVFKTIGPDGREAKLRELKKRYDELIIVDYSVPSAVNENAELFCKVGIPFVMGTTGGDREALERTVRQSGVPAVISPNMSPAIVLLLSMFEHAATTYPDTLKGFSLEIVESHQAGKKDKSGTAQKVGELLGRLGVNYRGEDSIKAIRNRMAQLAMGILPKYLDGHGWHTYRLVSPDGSVTLEFTHNVNGRQTYVDGTIPCIDFLMKKIEETQYNDFTNEPPDTYFTVIDVMKG
ncbi:MAG: dihydrodipicolinate reductase [Candidatus Moranbacteria bacterium]|nr:dihydrodipicolinate reductase [Candidatus Moranbacteria bacterium]NTW45992.1 dihydrodipicolinate reductase [Candidatus Moranbacteria bacterium]